ncbi:hypothetical protein [Actinomyces mediterranea]|nr:hypothetical protein [Actinomyces mediterranea]
MSRQDEAQALGILTIRHDLSDLIDPESGIAKPHDPVGVGELGR